ncbi:MAG: 2-amino-4-hydroxy-6-hydroxymethyldihydropteridine diphosphokinase [Anaerolineales bacterium]
MPERAFVLLGSNLDPESNLLRAVAGLARLGEIRRVSSVYQSPPVARPGQPDFLNAAVLLETEHDPPALQRALRDLEAELGRVRGSDKHEARTIDLDLCLYGSRIDTGSMTLPDPDLLEHAYAAAPIAELDPAFRHPVTGEPMGQIARRLREEADLTRRDDIRLPLGTE